MDINGLLLVVLVTPAAVQDRDAARLLLTALRYCFANITLVWADPAYADQLVTWATTTLRLGLQIVRKFMDQTTFRPLPRR